MGRSDYQCNKCGTWLSIMIHECPVCIEAVEDDEYAADKTMGFEPGEDRDGIADAGPEQEY